MVWYKNLLIIACVNNNTEDYELRLFSREANLDLGQAALCHQIIIEPVALSSLDSHVLMFCVDNVVRYYSMIMPQGRSTSSASH